MRPTITSGLLLVFALTTLLSASPESPQGTDIVATIGDRIIRMDEVDDKRRVLDLAMFNRLAQQVRDNRRRALDELIADAVLALDARRRGMTVEEVLAEIQSDIPSPDAQEVEAVYRNSVVARQGVPLAAVAPSVRTQLERQRMFEARRRFIAALTETYHVQVRESFEPPRQAVQRGPRDPVRGDNRAPVEIVEFSDFECPYCRQIAPVLRQLAEKYPHDVRLVWKHFPLSMHARARPAAEASACARDQGQFWAYHDLVFANQGELGREDLMRYAGESGLDVRLFVECVDTFRHRTEVDADVTQGRALGISATPTVFINGRMIAGAASPDAYERIIREELSSAASGARCTETICPVGAPGQP